MKKFFYHLFLLSYMTSAFAAVSPQVIPNDQVQIGKTSAGDKTIILNKGAGSANPKIKWNNSASKIQFSNDGSTFKNLGSGSGGGSGINLIGENNPGFEEGTTKWTNSGGGATFTTSGTTPGYEALSGVFNSSTTSQTLTADAVSIPSGLQGSACVASIWYKTTEATNKYKLQVYDGSVVLSESTLEATNGWDKTNGYAGFNCPSSGTISLRIISTGDGADISLDQAYLGEAKTVQVSQANVVGEAYYAGTSSCSWTMTSTGSTHQAFPTTSACPAPTVVSNTGPGTIQTTDADLPQFTVNNLPPGVYEVTIQGTTVKTSADGNAGLAIYDGTTLSGKQGAPRLATTNSDYQGFALHGFFTYTGTGNRTFAVYGYTQTDGLRIANEDTGANQGVISFQIKRYPTATDTVVRMENLGWYIDTNIRGADVSLGTSAQSQALVEDGSLTLGICDQTGSNCTTDANSGSAPVTIACSGTNASTGNTCSAGNEANGLVFTVPQAGRYEVCTYFTYAGSYGNASANPKFDLIETSPTNSATVISYGRGPRQASAIQQNINNNNGDNWNMPVGSCSTFDFASAGTKAIRMIYTQNAWTSGFGSNAILGTSYFSTKWSVKPLGMLGGIPVSIKGLVTSNTSGKERTERATIAEGSNCTTGSCTINRQSGNWLSSVTWTGTGTYSLTFAAGIFSGPPTCTGVHWNGSVIPSLSPFTSTSGAIQTLAPSAAANTRDIHLICMGPQ